MSREICRDCRLLTGSPVTGAVHAQFGEIVGAHETVCTACYGKRYDEARDAFYRAYPDKIPVAASKRKKRMKKYVGMRRAG